MKPLVGIIMGSTSDWETMRAAAEALDKLGVPYETRVVSAHRTPDLLFEYASTAQGRGIEVIIAGAGGAAHLPGMTASKTTLPVLGVPVQSKALNGLDSLLSIVQMPAGIPVATFAIGVAGATNAGLAAAAILANKRPEIDAALKKFRAEQTAKVLAKPDPVEAAIPSCNDHRHRRRRPARAHDGPRRLSTRPRLPVPRHGCADARAARSARILAGELTDRNLLGQLARTLRRASPSTGRTFRSRRSKICRARRASRRRCARSRPRRTGSAKSAPSNCSASRPRATPRSIRAKRSSAR